MWIIVSLSVYQARGKIGDFIKGVFAVFQGAADLERAYLSLVVMLFIINSFIWDGTNGVRLVFVYKNILNKTNFIQIMSVHRSGLLFVSIEMLCYTQ